MRRRKRAEGRDSDPPILAGDVEIRPDLFRAFVRGASSTSPREFALIRVLAAAQGRVMEREDSYERVWGYAMVRGDRSVDVFVANLRHTLARARRGGATSIPISASAIASRPSLTNPPVAASARALRPP